MGFDPDVPQLDDYVIQLIKYKARQLVGRAGFSKDDREDIEQDLTLDLLRRLSKFDPSRATFHTFVARVVEHGVATLIERRQAAIRDHRRCTCSLNDLVDDGQGGQVERGDLFSQDDYLRIQGRSPAPMEDRVALRVDRDKLLATLPPELRDLCLRFEAGQTITDISRDTGTPRGTLYERMKKLKALAEDDGLRAYLRSD
jgi:RNA polymerase sigma-70 factor (ECF subfamily)